jgi:hypothetical protein
MKQFEFDSQDWRISDCGLFVATYFHNLGEWSGWYNLEMFKPEFKEAAKNAK